MCGSTISNVTGHNYQNLVDKQCGIGSKVKIKRAGLVIPYLEEVLTPSTNLNIPNNTYQEGVDLYLKDKSVTEVTIQRLVHFAKTLDLDQAGEASLSALLQTYPIIENPIYLMKSHKFIKNIDGTPLLDRILYMRETKGNVNSNNSFRKII